MSLSIIGIRHDRVNALYPPQPFSMKFAQQGDICYDTEDKGVDTMAICPRCGAENKPGHSTCYSCWAPLPTPQQPPEHATSSAPAEQAAPETPPSPQAPAKPSRSLFSRRKRNTPQEPAGVVLPEDSADAVETTEVDIARVEEHIATDDPAPLDEPAVIADPPAEEEPTAVDESIPPTVDDEMPPVDDVIAEIGDESCILQAFTAPDEPAVEDVAPEDFTLSEEPGFLTEPVVEEPDVPIIAEGEEAEVPAIAESVVVPEIIGHEDDPAACDESFIPAEAPAPSTPHNPEFVYVAEPVVRAEERGTAWLIGVSILLFLLLLAVLLVWMFSFRGRTGSNSLAPSPNCTWKPWPRAIPRRPRPRRPGPARHKCRRSGSVW